MLGSAAHPIMNGAPAFPLFPTYFPTPRCRYGAIYGQQIAVDKKCSVGFSRLARLSFPEVHRLATASQ